MKPAAHIQTCIEMLTAFAEQKMPFSRYFPAYFKKRRYAGSKDRRAIFHMAMRIFRSYFNLNRALQACHLEKSYRSLMLLYLFLIEKKDIFELKNLFTGDYAPDMLTKEETNALSLLSGFDDIDYGMELPDFILPSLIHHHGEVILGCFTHMSQNILKPYFRSNPHKITYYDLCEKMKNDGLPVLLPDPEVGSFVHNGAPSEEPSSDHLTPYLIKTFGEAPIQLRNYPPYQEGYMEVQDKGSQILCELIHTEPQQILWDWCAGAGGKSLYLGSKNPQLDIIISDITKIKLTEAQKRFKRADIKKPKSFLIPNDLSQMEHYKGKVDILLLDVPCSGSGTWQRHPDLKTRLNAQYLDDIIQKQQSIIQSALPYLKAGGKLIYITCSLFDQENEHQIKYILKNNPEMRIKPINAENIHTKDIQDRAVKKGYIKEKESPFLKIYPNVENSDGFFISILEKEQ